MVGKADPFDYGHVLLRAVGFIRVKYKIASTLELRPYELEEDADTRVAIQEANEDPSPPPSDAGERSLDGP